MIRLKVFLFAIALTLASITSAKVSGEGYSYAFMLDDETSRTYAMESVPEVKLGNQKIYPGNCFFTPELKLSGLKNPVLRRWDFMERAMGFDPSTPYPYTLLSYGNRYMGVPNPGDDKMTALPAIDGLRWGRNQYLETGQIYTVGEMPANKDDIIIRDFTTQIIKGESMDGEIISEPSQDGTHSEAEIRFSASGLADLDQAYARINIGNDVDYCNDPIHGGEIGQFECFAITPAGEIELYYIGGGEGEYYFLLPANTQQIVLRIRLQSPEPDCITSGDGSSFISEVVQPGYHTVPELGFDINELTGEYDEFEATTTTTLTTLINGYPTSVTLKGVNTAYDFDGDGILEWSSKYTEPFTGNNKNALATFNKDFNQLSIVTSNFGNVLGFTSNNGNIFGYDESSIFSIDKNYNRKELYNCSKPRFALIDFNNNGKTDFINLADNSVITLDSNGNAAIQMLKTMTMNEYLGIRPPGDNPLGSGMSVIGDSKCPPAVFASYVQTDINGDGYPDFIDATSGNYYMNLGDGRFVKDSFGGTLLFRDFDGDGINDFLLYDIETRTISLTLQRIGTDAVVKKLISGYYCDDDIWIRDFDKDGDLDILIPFSAKSNSGMSFLVMFENDGRGSFKKKEYVLDQPVNFRKCIDWNSDGNYEALADMVKDSKTYSTEVGKIPSFTINGLKVNTTPNYIISDLINVPNSYNWTEWLLKDVVDFDNTGRMRFLFENFVLTPPVASNTRPQKPAVPQLSFDSESGELTVIWTRGSDKETSPADLTYELRIGSTPGGDDIMSAAATADGKRRNALRGNCGYELKRKFNTASWPNGNIYVSLQVIDDSGLGSEFSDAAVFKNSLLPAQFIIEAPLNVAVYEEIVLKATSDVAGLSVVWSAEGGELLSASNNEGHMRFTTPGIKTIAMTVSDGTGNSRTVTRDIDIYPIRFEIDSEMPAVDWAADLDMDGVAEVHYQGTFYEGDKTGKYTKLKSLFNTLYYSIPITTADINRDGMPDIIHRMGHLINTGGKAMDDATPDNFVNYRYLPDLDNDGLRDVYDNLWEHRYVMKNSGNYADFIEIDSGIFYGYSFDDNTAFYDFNGDGLIDILFLRHNEPVWFENLGNLRFRAHQLPTKINGILVDYLYVDDFDGNGKADFLCYVYDNGYQYSILWDNNERTPLSIPEINSGGYRYCAYDFDNNGCNDLLVSYINTSTGDGNLTVFLFNPDHTLTSFDVEGPWIRDEKPYLRSDGAVGLSRVVIKCAPNEKPSAPAGVKAVIEGNELVITWDAATDKETPSAALRYNLSVKHANAEDEQAYIISPLNGGINGVPVPNDAYLIGATRFPIPLMSLSPDEYEIKVQAVDSRMCPGDFSAPITVKVNYYSYDAPTETMVGSVVAITFSSGVNLKEVDFGKDAVVESITGQVANVYWTTDGVKTITAGNLQFTILVHPYINASFYLPSEIWGDTKVYLPADAAYEHTWVIRGYLPGVGTVNISTTEGDRIDDSTIALLFSYNSRYGSEREVIHTVTAPYGSSTFTYATNIKGILKPYINIVDIDDESGKYCVWPGDCEDAVEYMVYRESETAGNYVYLGATLPNEPFIDWTSSPRERSSRYNIKARLYYGETLQSQPHQPIHAIISKGISGEWNISWNKYVGVNVLTYRILRGYSPSSMECIAEVSGNVTSYSDFDAPQATQYYVVETLIAKSSASQAPQIGSRAGGISNYWRSRSNTVSTDLSAVYDITVDGNHPVDIFNLQGICIKRDATPEDIENLAPGFYIINGKKVYVMKH